MQKLIVGFVAAFIGVSGHRSTQPVDPHAGHPQMEQSAGVGGAFVVPSERGPGVRDVPPPAGHGSGMYSLVAGGTDRAYLTWIEPLPDKASSLRFARLEQGRWSPAKEIAQSSNWFVNWADHPSLAALPDGSLAAHWLVNNDTKQGSYGYGIRIAHSRNGGDTWRTVFSAGTDNTRDYSGFVTFLPDTGGFSAAYLTPQPGREEADHVMGLKIARFDHQGATRSDVVADPDTCTCCTTTMVMTSAGPIAAYRDHQAGEIRDISLVRFVNGRWTAPQPVHRDGWEINACPTNGPVLAAAGSRVAIAWFTAARNEPRVKVAFSNDAGARFSPPVVIDGGRPVGWPSIVLLDDGSAVVGWLESLGGGVGEIRVRRIRPNGQLGPATKVASAAAGRSAGIPQMVRHGDGLLVAWRQEQVVTALVPIPVG